MFEFLTSLPSPAVLPVLPAPQQKNQGSKKFERIRMFRPISSVAFPHPVETGSNQQNRTLHMVVTLQGRSAACAKFLEQLKNVAHAAGDPPFRLTLVYFIDESSPDDVALKEVEQLLKSSEQSYGLRFTLITKREAFSRGKGLQYGATDGAVSTRLPGAAEDVLSFMDIDMVFSREYLSVSAPASSRQSSRA
jgi:hypothetical protein